MNVKQWVMILTGGFNMTEFDFDFEKMNGPELCGMLSTVLMQFQRDRPELEENVKIVLMNHLHIRGGI